MIPRSAPKKIRSTIVGRHIKFGGLVMLCALAFTVGSASAEENWRYVKTLEGDVTVELDIDSIERQRLLGLSDYVASKMPTLWASVIRYSWPSDQISDGKRIRSVRVKHLWVCGQSLEVAEWGRIAYDSKGKVVIDKSKDFESEELPRFSRVSGDSERLGRQVCSLIGK